MSELSNRDYFNNRKWLSVLGYSLKLRIVSIFKISALTKLSQYDIVNMGDIDRYRDIEIFYFYFAYSKNVDLYLPCYTIEWIIQ